MHPSDHLLTADQIENMEGLHKTHFLNPNAVRINKSLGDRTGLTGLGTVLQNTLENSNVSVVEELVNMITTQRAYEMNSKVISTSDQMLSFITQNL